MILNTTILFYLLVLLTLLPINLFAQNNEADDKDVIVYHLTIDEKTVNFSGKDRQAIAVNNQIPAPTLNFTEGQTAVIYVHNKLSTETSVHWHGLLLPNVEDGVPYLTTPPILPNTTYKYEFPLIHSGTFWYHSHTGLQEQQGVYGAIVIQPKQPIMQYDKELTVVLSDWTDEKPTEVLRNLKRDNEWYSVKRNTGQPLIPSIKKGLLNERWILYKNRMPDMHIADIAYDAFLSNGKQQTHYPEFNAGERIRVRIVNAGASTYFWLNAAQKLNVVSADGNDVEPTAMEKLLIAIAETYDILVTIPDSGKLEIQASAMDGSGTTSFYLGRGEVIPAPDIAKPDYFKLMEKVAELHKGAHQGHLIKPYVKIIQPQQSLSIDEGEIDHSMHNMGDIVDKDENEVVDHSMHDMNDSGEEEEVDHSMHDMSSMLDPNVATDFNYDFLKSKTETTLPKNRPVREIMMNLDANMLRYIWTINGKPLSEDDKILIKKGEVVRIIMNNNTMMHHPMHLHGHFFRVLNKQGDYSPLKHTVDVAPFESTTIEFDANEQGDWFFHCHVLYHMKSGMSRVFSYGTPRANILKNFPYETLFKHDKSYTHWADLSLSSQQTNFEYRASNTYNEFITEVEYGWNENLEAEFRYERYTGKHFRWFGAINAENEIEDDLDSVGTVGIVGFRYLLLSILDAEVQLDHRLRPGISFDLHLPLTRRIALESEYEWISDFNLTDTLDTGTNYEAEHTISVGFEYIVNKDLSLTTNYDNRFGFGAGLLWRF